MKKYIRTFYSGRNKSKANWDPDQPRECASCGRTLRITKDSIVMRRYPTRETFCASHFPAERFA